MVVHGVDASHLTEIISNDQNPNGIFYLKKDALNMFNDLNKEELKANGFGIAQLKRMVFSNTTPSYCIKQDIERVVSF